MGENEEVTTMVLKVDLQCQKCYKKVKKVLCKFPQIRDQKYNEKQNTVEIKVLCCNPEKIRDKICCKGGCVITSIEIIKKKKPSTLSVQPPPTSPVQPPPTPPVQPPPTPPVEPPPPTPPPMKPCHPPMQLVPCVPMCRLPVRACCMDCYLGRPGGPCHPPPQPVPCVPRYQPPIRACCMDCYQGRAGGPCHSGYGGGRAPYIQYDGYYGRSVYDSYGGSSMGYCVTSPDYFSEENPSACRVM